MALRLDGLREDLTHIVTEEGIANLLLCRMMKNASRQSAVWQALPCRTGTLAPRSRQLRDRGVLKRAEDLGIDKRRRTGDAPARSIKDLVHWSGGLYEPPRRFRNW